MFRLLQARRSCPRIEIKHRWVKSTVRPICAATMAGGSLAAGAPFRSSPAGLRRRRTSSPSNAAARCQHAGGEGNVRGSRLHVPVRGVTLERLEAKPRCDPLRHRRARRRRRTHAGYPAGQICPTSAVADAAIRDLRRSTTAPTSPGTSTSRVSRDPTRDRRGERAAR